MQHLHIYRASSHRIGHVFWLNGYKEEAENYFDQQLDYCNKSIELGRSYAHSLLLAYYDLAAVYAFRGEREKAYMNLRIFNQREFYPFWMATEFPEDRLFESLRNEPDFQQIVRDVQSKYQSEHNRVRKWLEGNEML